ncbi:MAG: hypothetical protein HQK51_01680 [Oligoflexia bacterium]|nr:hypothetical protein [Oligoflexia bacterium]
MSIWNNCIVFYLCFFLFSFTTFISAPNFSFATSNLGNSERESITNSIYDSIDSLDYLDADILENNSDEPAYCDPLNFHNFEVDPSKKIERMHLFQLGSVVIGGMAIGKSSTKEMEMIAKNYSQSVNENNYCTWYVGNDNYSAMKELNHKYIKGIYLISSKLAASKFIKILGGSFFKEKNNFLACAQKHHYIAVGCDQQKHRGPSTFAMILAFSGCTPEHASTIANNVWGLNGLPAKTRIAIARTAYQLGNSNPEEQAKLRSLFQK